MTVFREKELRIVWKTNITKKTRLALATAVNGARSIWILSSKNGQISKRSWKSYESVVPFGMFTIRYKVRMHIKSLLVMHNITCIRRYVYLSLAGKGQISRPEWIVHLSHATGIENRVICDIIIKIFINPLIHLGALKKVGLLYEASCMMFVPKNLRFRKQATREKDSY